LDTASNAPARAAEAAAAGTAATAGIRPEPPAPPLAAAPRETRSLFGEILDWMLAPLLLLWPMSIAVTYLVAQTISSAPFDRQLAHTMTVLSQQINEDDGRLTFALPASTRALLQMGEDDQILYQVVGPRGELVAGDTAIPQPSPMEIPETGVTRYRDDIVRGQEMRIAYTWVEQEKWASNTPILVQAAETLDKRAQLAHEIIKGVIIPQFVILPIAVVLVWFGLSRGIAPLNALQARIRARRPDDLSPINASEAPTEIAPLVGALNDLLQRLDQSVAVQKRFVGDAAHQMKTPLAGLRTQAELALRHTTDEEARRSLRQLVTSAERSTHIINQLLALARAENRETMLQRSEIIDLRDVARAQTREWVPEALARSIDLGFEEPAQAATVRGNALMLSELLKNLVDNALRYTPAGGTVTVRVTADEYGRYACLEVEDTGPGIPESERGLVFERFYRILGSSADGSGLGLAIVREIAQQHDAELSVSHNPHATAPHGPGTLIGVRFALTDGAREGYESG
jgi:two-component system sensor histidine kinase TctE